MPDFHLGEAEADSLIAFLWAQPASSPAAASWPAEEPPPGDAVRGRILLSESRCLSCHTIEGRGNGSAPELAGIASKVSRRWLAQFLEDPHAIQPDTRMPRYDFTRQDVLDLSQYMMEEFIDPEAPVPAPGPPYKPASRAIEAGGKLYKKYGCGGCHRIAGRTDAAPIGPELTGIGDKPVALLDFGARGDLPQRLPDWLAAKVSDPRSFRAGLRMPDFGFTPEELQALVTALLSCSSTPVPERDLVRAPVPSYTPPGRFGALVERYRCLSCHQIQDAGGDISAAPLTAEGSKVKRDWLKRYLLVPTTIRPILTDRMIPLRMPADVAGFMADIMAEVYVDNRIPGEIFPDGPPPPLEVERGRTLFFERHGCQACHSVGGRGGAYGPFLDGVGERLRSGWVFWWLRGPQRWRADARCPDYGLDETDARDLAAFVVSIPVEGSGSGAGAGRSGP
jgi:cytochrome c2